MPSSTQPNTFAGSWAAENAAGTIIKVASVTSRRTVVRVITDSISESGQDFEPRYVKIALRGSSTDARESPWGVNALFTSLHAH
ncbi:hypothetical protein D3C85_1323110 [compost metagenome]